MLNVMYHLDFHEEKRLAMYPQKVTTLIFLIKSFMNENSMKQVKGRANAAKLVQTKLSVYAMDENQGRQISSGIRQKDGPRVENLLLAQHSLESMDRCVIDNLGTIVVEIVTR